MKILLADDDRVFRLMLARILPKWGYRPIVVGNGEEAWRQLERPGGPSIAILDWIMPEADGLEVCRRVRSCNLSRYIYLILLTSKATSEDLMAGLEAGADDYLPKPVNLDELRLRLKAARRVLASEGRHRHIAENASDGIITMDKENRILFANSAVGDIFGYPRAELLGLDFASLAPDFDRHPCSHCPETSETGNDIERPRSWEPVEIIGKPRSGRSIVLEISFSESRHSGQERVLTAMIRDVTERRRSEGQRSQAQKLESIGQLAAGIAHEINTPIQYIGDNLQFIQESLHSLHAPLGMYRRLYRELGAGTVDEKTIASIRYMENTVDFEYLEQEIPNAIRQAQEGAQHVAEIVRAMKEFAHPGAVVMVPTDLTRLIKTTVLVSRNHWKYVADLNLDLDPDLPPVACLAGEVNQVLLNLIVNAADAITDAQRERPGEKGVITISTRSTGNYAEIRLADSGTGIPEAIRSKIFDPFFTTKDVGKGSGQGLALAYATIVQKHQGTLDFETALGAGTTFIVRLPLSQFDENQTPMATPESSVLA